MFLRLFSIALLLTVSGFSRSAIVTKVRAGKCLIHLEGDESYSGDHYMALNLHGSPRGLVRLEKVKNGKAIARIIEGVVEPNWILEKTSYTKLPAGPQNYSASPSPAQNQFRTSVGVFAKGFYSTVIKSIQRGRREFSSLSGGGALFAAFKLTKNIALSAQLGGEYLLLKETENTSTNNRQSFPCRTDPCQTRVFIWSLPLSLVYYIPLNQPAFDLWVSAGFGLTYWGRELNQDYHVFSKSIFNVLSNAGHASIGADIHLSPSLYIPVSLSFNNHFMQNLFISSKRKYTFSQIAFHIGLGKRI